MKYLSFEDLKNKYYDSKNKFDIKTQMLNVKWCKNNKIKFRQTQQ